MARFLLFLYCLLLTAFQAGAQGTLSGSMQTEPQGTVSGIVTDRISRRPLRSAAIINIYTNETVHSDSTGAFAIGAAQGHLIEISAPGYAMQPVRIPQGTAPSRYAIGLKPALPELVEPQDPRSRYSRDSMALYAKYQRALALQKLTGIYAVYSPFSALSKRNRQIWRFQDEFYEFEREKFIDYVFSDSLVHRITALSGDSLARYKRYARPSYERTRAMRETELYAYIRESAKVWLQRQGVQRNAQ